MDRWLFLIVILCFLFVLTYDPKKGNLSKYVNMTNPHRKVEKYTEPCCNNVEYMAEHNTQCKYKHYTGIQFGDTDYGCPEPHPKAFLGAILKR